MQSNYNPLSPVCMQLYRKIAKMEKCLLYCYIYVTELVGTQGYFSVAPVLAQTSIKSTCCWRKIHMVT